MEFLSFWFLDDFEGNTNIFVAIKSSSTVLRVYSFSLSLLGLISLPVIPVTAFTISQELMEEHRMPEVLSRSIASMIAKISATG